MFDGKISVVRKDGHWLLYARTNLKIHGGRFVVVARSLTSAAWGNPAYADFQQISIRGYVHAQKSEPGAPRQWEGNHVCVCSHLAPPFQPTGTTPTAQAIFTSWRATTTRSTRRC